MGLDAEVVVDLAEGDFELPRLDEPVDDLQRLLRQVGAEQGLWIEAAALLGGLLGQPVRAGGAVLAIRRAALAPLADGFHTDAKAPCQHAGGLA